jgi:hypothetical protein
MLIGKLIFNDYLNALFYYCGKMYNPPIQKLLIINLSQVLNFGTSNLSMR